LSKLVPDQLELPQDPNQVRCHTRAPYRVRTPFVLCRFSLLSRVRLLILKDFHASDRPEFFFIEYSFSFINRVRGPHSVSEKHRHTFDST
jgi:hypothetical protein